MVWYIKQGSPSPEAPGNHHKVGMIPWKPFQEIPNNPRERKDTAPWFPGVEKWEKATPHPLTFQHFPAPGLELNPFPLGSPSPGTGLPRATPPPSAISEPFLPHLPVPCQKEKCWEPGGSCGTLSSPGGGFQAVPHPRGSAVGLGLHRALLLGQALPGTPTVVGKKIQK